MRRHERRAQKRYHNEGSTPAYHYVSLVVNAAQRQSTQAQAQVRAKGKGGNVLDISRRENLFS